MNRRLVIAGVATAAVAGAVVPAFAAPSGTATSPVTVYTDTSNGVTAGFYVNGQPGAGAHVSPDGQVCVGVSLQLPVCADAGAAVNEVEQSVSVGLPSRTRQSLPLPPVVVYQDENGTTVGVGNVGVRAGNDGRVCPLVSTQTWQCIGGEG